MGMLHLTQGNVIDYDAVVNKILQINEKIAISAIAYDSWNATQFILNCQEQGLPMQEFPQSLASFNRPTKEFERLIKMGRVAIDNNEITRWCFANCALKIDHNANCKPIKGGDHSLKIDGTIAMLECLGNYLSTPQYTNEITTLRK